jgi:hypothetical protein
MSQQYMYTTLGDAERNFQLATSFRLLAGLALHRAVPQRPNINKNNPPDQAHNDSGDGDRRNDTCTQYLETNGEVFRLLAGLAPHRAAPPGLNYAKQILSDQAGDDGSGGKSSDDSCTRCLKMSRAILSSLQDFALNRAAPRAPPWARISRKQKPLIRLAMTAVVGKAATIYVHVV